jgi:hypothetical protein
MAPTSTQLIPLDDSALHAARPDWPYSKWTTGHLMRTGGLGSVRVGRRLYVTPARLDSLVARHTRDVNGAEPERAA